MGLLACKLYSVIVATFNVAKRFFHKAVWILATLKQYSITIGLLTDLGIILEQLSSHCMAIGNNKFLAKPYVLPEYNVYINADGVGNTYTVIAVNKFQIDTTTGLHITYGVGDPVFQGRATSIKLTFLGEYSLVCMCIYALNEWSANTDFMSRIVDKLCNSKNKGHMVMLGGDFNAVKNHRLGRSSLTHTEAHNE